MGRKDEVLVFYEIMDEVNELGKFVSMIGEVNVSTVEAVVQYSLIIMVVLLCLSGDSQSQEIYEARVDRAPQCRVYGVL